MRRLQIPDAQQQLNMILVKQTQMVTSADSGQVGFIFAKMAR
jgi:hypothetical protein